MSSAKSNVVCFSQSLDMVADKCRLPCQISSAFLKLSKPRDGDREISSAELNIVCFSQITNLRSGT